MAKLPVLKPQDVVARLHALGFVEVRQRGSHKQFRHPDGRGTTVPFHKGRDISPVLLRKIARDIGMPADDFIAAKRIAAEKKPKKNGRKPKHSQPPPPKTDG